MDIKLRARLTAYSKIESMPTSGVGGSTGGGSNGSAPLPDIDLAGDGTILGVKDGKYTMIPSVDLSAIGGLFGDTEIDPTTIHVSQIDTLFPDFQEAESIKKSDIDTLFDDQIKVDTKVSFDAIDSLFK